VGTRSGRNEVGALRERVHHLARRDGDLTVVRARLDTLLRASIGYDVGVLSTMDPATLLWTSCFITGLDYDRERERELFELEFEGGDVNHYTDLAGATTPIGRLHAATGGRLTRARRYVPLLEPLAVADELRAILRVRDTCWGSVTLYRQGDAVPFDERDERALADAITSIADLFRLALLRAALDAPATLDQPPGLLLVGNDGHVEATTEAASAWLDAIDDRDRIPSAVRAVSAAAAAGDGLARASLPTRDGRWVVLHGSPVKHEGARGTQGPHTAIIIEGARPSVLSEVIAEAYALSGREREVTSLVARGRTTKQIALELGISAFTVQDHLKSVFAKTGAQSRGELVATMFAQQYEPRNERGCRPGPYGWYLDDDLPATG
jgi:DNA-binding CsgD family transcriptional regulator